MKKVLGLAFALLLVMYMAIPTMAADIHEPSDPPQSTPSQILPRAAVIPTEEGSFPYDAKVTNLEPGHLTYSRYYFRPTGSVMAVAGTVDAVVPSTEACFQVKILLDEKGISSNIDSVTTDTFSDYDAFEGTFINLDPHKFYYVAIQNLTPWALGENRNVSGYMTFLED